MTRTTLEQLYGANFRAMPRTIATSASNQFAGRTTIDSGSATVTVSTTAVESDSIIAATVEMSVSSWALVPMVVTSINPGNAFVFGWSDGTARARDMTVMWRIVGQ